MADKGFALQRSPSRKQQKPTQVQKPEIILGGFHFLKYRNSIGPELVGAMISRLSTNRIAELSEAKSSAHPRVGLCTCGLYFFCYEYLISEKFRRNPQFAGRPSMKVKELVMKTRNKSIDHIFISVGCLIRIQ